MRRICTTAALVGLIALAASTTPAFASGFTLDLSAPSTPVVGKPLILEASGTIDSEGLALNIRPASGPAAIAAYARSGIRSCRALLSRPGDCVRRIVRTANARCRRLPSPRGRTTCLRAVRRVSGS